MVQRGRNWSNTKTSVIGSWAEMRKGWPGWEQTPGLLMEILPGPPDVQGFPSPEDRLMLLNVRILPTSPTPSSHIVSCTYPVSVLYTPRSIQSLNVNTLFHASVPLYVLFLLPGKPSFFFLYLPIFIFKN